MTPRTAWIGGSYEAATRGAVIELPRTAIAKRHAPPGMGADAPLLKLIEAMPGSSTEKLLSSLPEVKPETASQALHKMQQKNLIHRVKISIVCGPGNRKRPGNLWYPGPAPVTVNHMAVGRPREGVRT